MKVTAQTITTPPQGQVAGQDPLAFLAKAYAQIEALSKQIVGLNQSLTSVPPTQLSPVAAGQNPQVQLNMLQQQLAELQKIQNGTEQAKSQLDQMLNTISNMLDSTQKTVNRTMENVNAAMSQQANAAATQGAPMGATASKKFNLKKLAQQTGTIPPILSDVPIEDSTKVEDMNTSPLLKDEIDSPKPTVSGLSWHTAADLMRFLNRKEMNRLKAESILMELVPDEQKEGVTSFMEEYYEGDLPEESKLEIAVKIWHMLPDLVKTNSPQNEENIMSSDINAFVKELVKTADEQIRKIASQTANKKEAKTVFNLTKTAQHKSMNNVILYGPDQVYMDEFTRQPASRWSLIERNKGFGLVVDDVWDIDWEAIWRGNIMDKYSRPYRNDKGEWVGGYIQKRFEVDKWIPEGNNYQLLPGERRRAYVPEQRSLETRMVAQRASGDAPYESNDKSKPFNWKEASSKGIKKEAEKNPMKEQQIIFGVTDDIKRDIYDLISEDARVAKNLMDDNTLKQFITVRAKYYLKQRVGFFERFNLKNLANMVISTSFKDLKNYLAEKLNPVQGLSQHLQESFPGGKDYFKVRDISKPTAEASSKKKS